MKKFLVLLGLPFLIAPATCRWGDKQLLKELEKEETKKRAYLLGYSLGARLQQTQRELDQKIFLTGLQHSLEGKKPLISPLTLRKTKGKSREQAPDQEKTEDSMDGKKFLQENGKKPDVKTTASGLQYKVLKAGEGRSPSAEDTVEVHYRGTLINGKEFDSSYKRNKSVTFPLGGVIKGWTEGLQLMKEGAEYEFYIPPELGYGTAGTSGIPPNSVLIFKVVLIKVL